MLVYYQKMLKKRKYSGGNGKISTLLGESYHNAFWVVVTEEIIATAEISCMEKFVHGYDKNVIDKGCSCKTLKTGN